MKSTLIMHRHVSFGCGWYSIKNLAAQQYRTDMFHQTFMCCNISVRSKDYSIADIVPSVADPGPQNPNQGQKMAKIIFKIENFINLNLNFSKHLNNFFLRLMVGLNKIIRIRCTASIHIYSILCCIWLIVGAYNTITQCAGSSCVPRKKSMFVLCSLVRWAVVPRSLTRVVAAVLLILPAVCSATCAKTNSPSSTER